MLQNLSDLIPLNSLIIPHTFIAMGIKLQYLNSRRTLAACKGFIGFSDTIFL